MSPVAGSLTPDEVAAAAEEARRADRMELCPACGRTYDRGSDGPSYVEDVGVARFRAEPCVGCLAGVP